MNKLCLVSMLLLIGCATPQVTSSTDRTVIVRAGIPDMGVEQALQVADKECAKRGLSARVQQVTSPTTDRYIFECVKS